MRSEVMKVSVSSVFPLGWKWGGGTESSLGLIQQQSYRLWKHRQVHKKKKKSLNFITSSVPQQDTLYLLCSGPIPGEIINNEWEFGLENCFFWSEEWKTQVSEIDKRLRVWGKSCILLCNCRTDSLAAVCVLYFVLLGLPYARFKYVIWSHYSLIR